MFYETVDFLDIETYDQNGNDISDFFEKKMSASISVTGTEHGVMDLFMLITTYLTHPYTKSPTPSISYSKDHISEKTLSLFL